MKQPRQRSAAFRWRFLAIALLLLFAVRESGCDYSLSTSPTTPASLVISVSPSMANVDTGGILHMAATVVNYKSDSSVTWAIESGGVGQLAVTGNTATFTAPLSIATSPVNVTIVARSNEDTSKTATCVVTIVKSGTGPGNVAITLSPTSLTLLIGRTQQFSASVTGATDTAVVWSIVSGVGSLSTSGLFTAPSSIASSPTTTVIQATAHADPTKYQRAIIQITNPPDTGVCFQSEILPMLVSNCGMSGCHTAGGRSPNLTTYSGVLGTVRPGNASGSKLYSSITGRDDAMPPQGRTPLTSAQIALIAKWINEGAKNTSCTDTSSTCDTTNVSYSGFVGPVIQTYCVGCHTGASAGSGFDLTSYAGVLVTVKNGKLIGSIQQGAGFFAMPQSGPKLDACTISKISAWVNKGAPNN